MNLVFIVACSFPYGEASSARALSICRMLQSEGHNVHVISDYKSKVDSQCNVCTYEFVDKVQRGFLKKEFIVHRLMKILDRYCQSNKVDAILTNAKYDRFNQLVKYCKNNNLKLFVENCEWYHHSSFKLGFFDYRFWMNQKMISYDFKKADGFISISRLLDKHNKSFGKPSVRIPTILDTSMITPVLDMDYSGRKIHISFTGSIERSKELLKPFISVLARNELFRKIIQFDIYGPNIKQVLRNIGGNKNILCKAGESVVIHGRIPQDQMNNIISQSDFVAFLRPKRRSSNAGFPTKLGESMANGTPVIANSTGDIELYLENGKNGFIIEAPDEKSVSEVFGRIVKLKPNEYKSLRINSRKTAETFFDYRKYSAKMNEILSK